MAIKEFRKGNCVVLELSGKLMGGEETTEIKDHVKGLIDIGVTKIIFNLHEVKWMNSSGIGALTGSLNLLNEVGGKLAIANITDKIESLFVITQLSKIFSVYNSVEEALDSLQEKNP